MANDQSLPLVTRVNTWTVGGLLGGLVGSLTAVMLTQAIKQILDFVSGLGTLWWLLLPLLDVTLAVLILFGLGRGASVQTLVPQDVSLDQQPQQTWYLFPHDVARADLTGDVVNTAGAEETFPWERAPLRALAILSTRRRLWQGGGGGVLLPSTHIKLFCNWVSFCKTCCLFCEKPSGGVEECI